MFFRFILYSIIAFLILRSVRYVYRIMTTTNSRRASNFQRTEKPKSSIDQKDIIEADFEEIKESKESNESGSKD
ncbi:MAG: hypothetical protein K8F36_05985 [Melioribacteraceae bacterium]|nr:hypothetical protein [Melioribacteraceae bacterium]